MRARRLLKAKLPVPMRYHSTANTNTPFSSFGQRFHGKADTSFENSVWTLGAISLILPVGMVLGYDPVPADRNEKKKKAAMFGDDYISALSSRGIAVGAEAISSPASGRAYLVKRGLRQVCVTQYGTDTGTPMLLMHGLAASRLEAAAAVSLADPLPSGDAPCLHQLCVERGVRLLCVDRPGYGLTTPADSAETAPEEAAGDAVRVLDALRLPSARVVAVDIAALAALIMYEQHPLRVDGSISLLAPDYCRHSASSGGFFYNLRQKFLAMSFIGTPFFHFFAKFLRLTTLSMPPDSLKNAQLQNLPSASKDHDVLQRMSGELMLQCAQTSMDGGATGVQHDLTVQLGKHELADKLLWSHDGDVDLWVGALDQVVPREVPDTMQRRLPSRTRHALTDCGHLSAVAEGLLAVIAQPLAEQQR